MRITLKVKDLDLRLRQLGAVIASKAAYPVQEMAKLSFVQTLNGPSASITGTSQAATLTIAIPAQADTDGEILLPVKPLLALLGEVTTESITFETAENAAKYVAGRIRGKYLSLPVAGFDEVADLIIPESQPITLGLPGLKALIDKTIFAVPENNGKHTCTVGLLESTSTHLRIVATDGSRMVLATEPGNAGEFSYTLPRNAFELVSALDGTTVTLQESDSSFVFRTATENLFVKKSDGVFPEYQKVLPGDTAHKTEIMAASSALLGAAKIAASTADAEVPTVNIKVVENGPSLFFGSASALIGEGEGDIDVKTTGPAQDVRLNIAFLLPFLEKAQGDISIRLKHGQAVVDLRAGENYRFLIMPIVPTVPVPAAK